MKNYAFLAQLKTQGRIDREKGRISDLNLCESVARNYFPHLDPVAANRLTRVAYYRGFDKPKAARA
jgi:hypothetical protein